MVGWGWFRFWRLGVRVFREEERRDLGEEVEGERGWEWMGVR
jgi:hypothetical protein